MSTTIQSSTTMSRTTTKSPIQLSERDETMINKLANILLASSYRCTWVAYYFDRPECGLVGMADLHRWTSTNDVYMARKLFEYLKVRGGRVEFDDIPAPTPEQTDDELVYLVIDENGQVGYKNVSIKSSQQQQWSSKSVGAVLTAFNCLILGKRAAYDYVLKLYKSACESKDPHLTDFLEINYIRPMANENRKLGVLQSQANMACDEGGVGAYQFNKDIKKHLFEIIAADKLARPDKWSMLAQMRF